MRPIIAPAMLATAILIAAASGPAAADPYRWCAQDVGGSGASNCYFITLEQCQAAASGAGMGCTPNNFYTGPDGAAPRVSKKKKQN